MQLEELALSSLKELPTTPNILTTQLSLQGQLTLWIAKKSHTSATFLLNQNVVFSLSG
jgi:hypothetical protein